MMPLGGLLLAVFVGWKVAPAAVAEHVDMKNQTIFRVWFWLLRYLVPVSIAGIFISNL
jgi:NSS family neurotransmitter:Na+ symporter